MPQAREIVRGKPALPGLPVDCSSEFGNQAVAERLEVVVNAVEENRRRIVGRHRTNRLLRRHRATQIALLAAQIDLQVVDTLARQTLATLRDQHWMDRPADGRGA